MGGLVKGVLGTSENGDELPFTLTEVALIAGKQRCYHYYINLIMTMMMKLMMIF